MSEGAVEPRRADFIWLADQPVRADGMAAALRGEVRRTGERTNRWVLFRHTFDLAAAPTHATWRLTCDGRYVAWLNGVAVGRGPARSTPHALRVDWHPVAATLRPGRNACAVLVHTPGVDLSWYETVKGDWQPALGDGGLYSVLTVEGPHPARDFHSDDSWRAIESDAWRTDAPRAGWGLDFIEDVDGRRLDPRWVDADYDDSHWPPAKPLRFRGDANAIAKGWGHVDAFPRLLRRAVPFAVEADAPSPRLLWSARVEPRADLDVDRRIYEERLLPGSESAVAQLAASLADDGAPLGAATTSDSDVTFMFAFDRCHAGRPWLEVEGRGGEVVEFAAAEALPGEYGPGGARRESLRRDPLLGCAHVTRYTLRPGVQRIEKFEGTAVRALQVTVRNAPQGMRIRRVGSIATHYPAAPGGAFECSDPLLTRLWEVARHTLLQCMQDAWEDCPGRERRQWIGDAMVGLDLAAYAFGPSALPLSLQALYHGAESQRPDGLLQMFAPGDHHDRGVAIPDFTLHWLAGLRRYVEYSGDTVAVEPLLPAALKALQWFADLEHPEAGLLTDVPHWHFIEWAHVDRAGWSAPINALYAAALASVAAIARDAGYSPAAARCETRRRRVLEALNVWHWDEARGVYVDSVDPGTRVRRRRVSQHANGLVLLHELAPAERRARVLDAITDDSRLKLTAAPPIVPAAPPFDQGTDVVRANTFFSHFVCDGIARAGRLDAVLAHFRKFYGPMLATGTTTLWESFAPSASLCHGFSATPVYQLSRHVLGVAPLAPGFGVARIAPGAADLSFARGSVATPHGAIGVDWVRDGVRIVGEIAIPAGCRPVFECDGGPRVAAVESRDGRYRVEWKLDVE